MKKSTLIVGLFLLNTLIVSMASYILFIKPIKQQLFKTTTELDVRNHQLICYQLDEIARHEIQLDQLAFLQAVIQRESSGNPNAIGDEGTSIGILQIQPSMIDEANRIVGKNIFKDEHRTNTTISKTIWFVVQNARNPEYNHQLAYQIWNPNHPNKWFRDIQNTYLRIRDNYN